MLQLSIQLRPTKLDDVYNQPGVVTELKKRARDKNWPQAMLLKGSSGTGKSTVSKIIAMSINCQHPDKDGNPCCKCSSCMSIIEERFDRDTQVLDGSAFSGKDDVVNFGQLAEAMPMYDKKKILIIEESDQLSVAAKNAMLKLLEKPRDHVVFILLSMVNSGIPPAIQSRCQTFTFKPFTTKDIMFALKDVMDKTNVWSDESIPQSFKLQGIAAIATSARGSLREAIQAYEKCLIGKYYTADSIRDNLGIVDEEAMSSYIRKLLAKDVTFLNDIYTLDINDFFPIAYSTLSDALIYKITGSTKNTYYENIIAEFSASPNLDELVNVFNTISENPRPYIVKPYFYAKLTQYLTTKSRLIEKKAVGRVPL